MLTGKCKEDFEKWYRKKFCAYGASIGHTMTLDMEYHNDIDFEDKYNFFNVAPFSMQYGVYVDFFDSVGIYLQVKTYFDKYEWKVEKIDTELRRLNQFSQNVATRAEARTKAIEKANEIYNVK